jgi:hypothetical protein
MCTGSQLRHFVVWSPSDVVVIDIPRNDAFINDMEAKLSKFFEDYFCEALLAKFLYRSTDKLSFDY